MGKWGVNQDETFEVTTLTADFADNIRLANVPYVIQAFLYIMYTQGDETELEIRVEESCVENEDPVTEHYFVETIADNSGYVEPFIFKLTASGNYRIPIQVGEGEDRMRVAVRGGGGAPPYSGTAKLFFSIR